MSDGQLDPDPEMHTTRELLAVIEQLEAERGRLRTAAQWVVSLYESRLATDDDLLDQLRVPMRALGDQLNNEKTA